MVFAIVCAIARDEASDLKEWVDYHLMIGFDRVVIFDNESVVPVRSVLREYVDAGVVVVTEIAGRGVQLSAYASFIKEFRKAARWVAFLDIDEFIVPKDCQDISALLERYAAFGGLGIHWRVFGSNGHVARPPLPVTEAYDRVLSRDCHIKTIVQMQHVRHVVSPHHFTYADNMCCVNEHGVPVFGAKSYHTSDVVQINHYYYKSQQDYEAKMARGFATPLLGADGYDMAQFYRQAGTAGEADDAIARFGAGMKRFGKVGHLLAANRLRDASEFSEMAVLEEARRLLLDAGSEAALDYLEKRSRYSESVLLGVARVKIFAVTGMREAMLDEVRTLLVRFAGDVEACNMVYGELARSYASLGMAEHAASVERMLAAGA